MLDHTYHTYHTYHTCEWYVPAMALMKRFRCSAGHSLLICSTLYGCARSVRCSAGEAKRCASSVRVCVRQRVCVRHVSSGLIGTLSPISLDHKRACSIHKRLCLSTREHVLYALGGDTPLRVRHVCVCVCACARVSVRVCVCACTRASLGPESLCRNKRNGKPTPCTLASRCLVLSLGNWV